MGDSRGGVCGFDTLLSEQRARGLAGGVISRGPKRPLFFFYLCVLIFFCFSVAKGKLQASVVVLWGLFTLKSLKSFVSFYKTVKVDITVYNLICVKLLLAMTGKTDRDTGKMLRLYVAGVLVAVFCFVVFSLYL